MITKKTKMYYETDDYSELTDFYNEEIEKLAEHDEAFGEEKYEQHNNLLTSQCLHDKQVFAWRQMHRDKYDKYLAKLDAKKQKKEAPRPQKNDPEPEAKPEPVKCTALTVSHSDIITSPTECGLDTDEYDEE